MSDPLATAMNKLGATVDLEFPGKWRGPNGCLYGSVLEYLQMGVLGLRGCGNPFCGCGELDEGKVEIMASVLCGIAAGRQDCLDLCGGSTLLAGFVIRALDSRGLIEYGAGLAGWITPKGQAFLEAVNTLAEQAAQENA